MGFPTKNDHSGMFWGYHHLRKHPYRKPKLPHFPNWVGQFLPSDACISGAKNFKDKPLASTAAEESLDKRRVFVGDDVAFLLPSRELTYPPKMAF